MTTKPTMLTTLIDNFATRVDEINAILDREARSPMIVGQAWIVTNAYGIPIKFEVKPEGKQYRATSVGSGKVESVNRFTREDALKLAVAVGGASIHWKDALEQQRDDLEQQIQDLTSFAEQQVSLD